MRSFGTSNNLVAYTAKGDGMGDKVDATKPDTLSDTYTVWVPPSVFGASQAATVAATHNKACFKIYVTAKKHGDGGGAIDIVSNPNKDWDSSGKGEGCNPAIFGESTVHVVELGEADESWSIFHEWTRQTRMHAEGEKEYVKKQGVEPPNGLDVYELKQQTRIAALDGAKNQVSLYVALGDSDLDLPGGVVNANEYLNRYYGETIGTYFGVSYGHKDVHVLTTADGMDLEYDHEAGRIFAFDKGKYEVFVGDINMGGTINFAGITGGLFTIAWGLSTGGWGMPLGVVSGMFTIISSVDNRSIDGASAYCAGEWRRKEWNETTEEWEEHPYSIFDITRSSNGTSSPTGLSPMNKDFSTVRVGETYVGVITMGASCALQDWWNPGWDKAQAYGMYKLTEGTFDANNLIRVDVNP